MDKSVVVTGASTGIGYQICSDLITLGYHVFGSVRQAEDGERLAAIFSGSFTPLYFDVTDHDAVDQAAQVVASKLAGKPLVGLFNNAGLAVAGPLLHLSIEDLRYQFEVNVIGLMKVTQAFAPLLGAVENFDGTPGRIVMISSVSGKIGMPFIGAYSGSKFALEGLSQSLRAEMLLYGIEVIVIGPGAVQTPIWDKSINSTMEKFKETPYTESLYIFLNKFVKRSIKTAISVEALSLKIVNIFTHPHPKSRYTMINQKFTNYLLPLLLPSKLINNILGKGLHLIKR